MKLIIKNMVCRQCVAAVRRMAESVTGLNVSDVGLGYVETDGKPDDGVLEAFNKKLLDEGFELIRSREAELVEKIKQTLIEEVRNPSEILEKNTSDLLSDDLGVSYSVLSRVFSSVEGRTIENYLSALRVERVKELIRYGNMSLSEIADAAGYSSVAHLSRRFKQQTGMTPSEFRELGTRTSIAEI